MHQTEDRRPIRILTLIDEYTKDSLAIRPERRIRANDVIDIFADVMVARGVPEYIRSDNGSEMVAQVLRDWLARVGTKTAYIMPGSPWENGYCESLQWQAKERATGR